MLLNHLVRRQLFMLKNCNKANFSMFSNGNRVAAVLTNKPMIKYNNGATIMLNKQQFRSFWHSHPIQSASNNGINTTNLGNLHGTEAATGEVQVEPINDDDGAKQVEKKEEEQPQSGTVGKQLARKFYRYGEQQSKWLSINYKMGRSGRKFLQFNKSGAGMNTHNFSNILVPEDIFAFVRAMDEVLEAVDGFKDKIQTQSKTNHPNQQQRMMLHTAMANGTTNDFELDLCMGRYLYVRMRTVPNELGPEHKSRLLIVPIRMFCWLRRAIGEMFVENGEQAVQQQLGEPPNLPDWLNKGLFKMFNRRQFYTLYAINKANPITMMGNGRITIFAQQFSSVLSSKPMLFKCKTAIVSTMPNQQQFRSLWLGCPLQNASDNESYINLDHLWATKPATIGGTQNQPKSGDWWTKPKEERKEQKDEQNPGIAATTAGTHLALKSIHYNQKWLNIHYKMGRSGQKYLQLNKSFVGRKTINFPKILVPEDVFAFVRAMDEVLNAVEANRDKIEAKINHPNQQQTVQLHTAKAKGTNYDFELDLCAGREVFVNMRTVPNERNPGHITHYIGMPIRHFHWMRRAIREMFVENGEQAVQQQLGVLPRLPEWLN